MTRRYGIILFLCALGVGGLLIAPDTLKERLLDIDEAFFDGLFRRTYHGQELPSIPATLPAPREGTYAWLATSKTLIIRHAMGPTATIPRNSLKAFENSIAVGDKLIEADIRLTTEGDLICFHGDESKQLSTKDYLALKKQKNLHPCYFSGLATVLRFHPEVYLVIDAKDDFVATYQKIVETAPDILGQLIPQIYDFEQIEWVRKYPFSGEIFTSYKSALTTSQIYRYALKSHIGVVTLTKERALKLDQVPPNLAVFTHTIDDPNEAAALFSAGFKGVYSNTIPSEAR